MIKIQLFRTENHTRATYEEEKPIMFALARLLLVYGGDSFEFKITSTLRNKTSIKIPTKKKK